MSENLSGICAVILAAGAGSRLGYPNERGGKPMVEALGKPLLAYGLERLAGAGLRDVALVVNPTNRPAIEAYAGDGSKWGLAITYVVQETPLGIAHALSLCQEFSGQRNVLLLLVDNLFAANIDAAVAAGYEAIIIADHGNADNAINADGTPNTAHSLNPVPCIYVTEKSGVKVADGRLADVAPTILKIMDLEQPAEMTGHALI